ncbi:MAG: DNA polymerase III subunit delta [Gammaproteobacteria bacterium]|nr:DNA polymerase III subunit delta [Gammaproteobacteria bacterium]
MKVYPDRFKAQLQKGLKPVYVIAGEEQLQVNECCDELRRQARQEGYTERALYSVDIDTGYDEFLQSSDNLSLFGERKIIEIRLPKGKTGKEWGQALNTYLGKPPPDTLLLVVGDKLERGVQSSAWYKKADALGVTVMTWPKNPAQMQTWVAGKMKASGLRASRSAIGLIVQRVEGNLLAAEQEIQKLALLYPDSEIGDAEVISSVANSSRYSVFDLTNAALEGNAPRAVRILQGLRAEAVAPVLIHWSLHQEVRTMSTIAQAQLAGAAPDAAIKSARVAPKKIPQVKNALHRHTERQWLEMLSRCARIDRLIKGRERGDIWIELQDLVLSIAGKKLALMENLDVTGY